MDLLVAGQETMATTLRWALLFMANHPEVQKKVQDEIDAKFGNKRPISFSDRSQLPYVESVLHEVMRFATTAPTANRRAVADFKFGQYVVRTNTTLTMNLYGIFRDPRIWNDPTHFNPDANFPLDGPQHTTATEHLCPFGIGKRVCLGETLARQVIFLFFTGLMSAFTVDVDMNLPLPPEDIGTPGITRSPLPFMVKFMSRE